jgi:hypothetical protein
MFLQGIPFMGVALAKLVGGDEQAGQPILLMAAIEHVGPSLTLRAVAPRGS